MLKTTCTFILNLNFLICKMGFVPPTSSGLTGQVAFIVLGRCRYVPYPVANIILHTIYFILQITQFTSDILPSIKNYNVHCFIWLCNMRYFSLKTRLYTSMFGQILKNPCTHAYNNAYKILCNQRVLTPAKENSSLKLTQAHELLEESLLVMLLLFQERLEKQVLLSFLPRAGK